MKHNYKIITALPDSRIKIGWRNAYHQAGYIAAIYLNNQQKQLPAVHFQISIKPHDHDRQTAGAFADWYSKYTVKAEDGRLIQSLPVSFTEATQNLSWFQKAEYRCAFEADVTNLLASSLTEARYILSREGLDFSGNLVNLSALHFYGGSSELELVDEYMSCFVPDQTERDEKLDELFWDAFRFVKNSSNWSAITGLAEYIRDQPIGIIPCDKLISLLESGSVSYNADANVSRTVFITKDAARGLKIVGADLKLTICAD